LGSTPPAVVEAPPDGADVDEDERGAAVDFEPPAQEVKPTTATTATRAQAVKRSRRDPDPVIVATVRIPGFAAAQPTVKQR
jgi:hypothetical protein